MVFSKKAIVFVTGATLFAQGVSAQNLRDFHYDRVTDARASAAITIPLGAQRGSAKSKPRFDFTLATQSVGASNSAAPMRFDSDYDRQTMRAAKFSFTLERNPRLLLNDQRVATFGPRLTADEEDEDGGGLSTGAGIAIGLGLLAGGLVFAAAETADEISDLVDED